MKKLWVIISISISSLLIALSALVIIVSSIVNTYRIELFERNRLTSIYFELTGSEVTYSLTNREAENPLSPFLYGNQLSDDIDTIARLIDNELFIMQDSYTANVDRIGSLVEIAEKLDLSYSDDISLRSIDISEYNHNSISIENARDIARDIVRSGEYINNLENIIITYSEERITNEQFSNPLWITDTHDLTQLVREMSDEELVGNLMIIGVNGSTLDDQQEQIIQTLNPSGFILMGSNIFGENQTSLLTTDLQSTNTQYPYFISVDQEGGVVKRVWWDSTPGQLSWKDSTRDELCDIGNQRANILKNAGFNLNYSPVADLSYSASEAFINDRTISNDPNSVSSTLMPYVECHEEAGVLTTLKHFPGHGMVSGDSHIILPQNDDIDKMSWKQTHAVPFIENRNASFVMVGHLKVPNIDTNPTSMSKIWLQDILRDELDYKGLVITDDMKQFQNISGEDLIEASAKSLNAGVDQLLYVMPPQDMMEIHEGLVADMQQNNLRSEYESKVLRVLETKRLLI